MALSVPELRAFAASRLRLERERPQVFLFKNGKL